MIRAANRHEGPSRRAAAAATVPAWSGPAALACYLAHASTHVRRGRPEDLLWTCNVAALLVAVGLLARRPAVTAVGTLWLAAGTPLWLADLLAGGEFLPTSLFTHFGSLSLGLLSARRDGVPRHTWWRALLGLIALQQLARLVTPREANVNMAFRVYGPLAHIAPSYPAYWALSTALFALGFALLSYTLGRLAAR